MISPTGRLGQMRSVDIGLLALVVCIALLLSGCFTTSHRMLGFATALERDSPNLELDHQFGLTLGRMSLGLAKGIAKTAADEDAAEMFEFFRGVKKVELATFEADTDGDVELPARLAASFERQGWQTLARFREDDEMAWILYRIRKDRLNNIMMMMLEDEELTLVRLGGRLDKILSAALSYVDDEFRDSEEQADATGVQLGR